ncbi:MAG: 5'-nucleotidase C-terminal domain-containing protein [Cyanobacteria bacterium P01_H01_bin.15]
MNLKQAPRLFKILGILATLLTFLSAYVALPVYAQASNQTCLQITQDTNKISQENIQLSPLEPVYTLQILHASDFEAAAEAIFDAPGFSSVVNALKPTYLNTIILSSGDNYIPSPFYSASADQSFEDRFSRTSGRADIEILNQIGIQASALGNHEFDQGPTQLKNLIASKDKYPGTNFPYISANLQFDESSPLSKDSGIVAESARDVEQLSNRVVPSAILHVNGESIGLVGVTTARLAQLSQEKPGTEILGMVSDDSDTVAAKIIQPFVDELTNLGIDKIILLSHLQQLSNEVELASQLIGIDVIIAGGSHNILASDDWQLRQIEPKSRSGDYPLFRQSADGKPVLIVNTDANYRYVGRLIVDFDKNGELSGVSPLSGPYPTDQVGVETAGGTADRNILSLVDKIDKIIETKDGTVLGNSTVFLNGERFSVRREETNLGNLTADANLAYAQSIEPNVVISIKNGGGIRASIGSICPAGGESPNAGKRQPNEPDLVTNKPVDGISQLDLETALSFNNGLTILTLNPEQLKSILEHSISELGSENTTGRFLQVAGLFFSFNLELPPGSRVRTVGIEENHDLRLIVRDGKELDSDNTFRIVTLDYLADGNEGFPFKDFEESSQRRDLTNTVSDDKPAYQQRGTEQFALAEYLKIIGSYDKEDTPIELDQRIQNLSFRKDTIFDTKLELN